MATTVQHGLRRNAFQFWTLVLINAFVGGMVGLERSILPEIAESEFGVDSNLAILSFIAAFGITKAFTNYSMGKLANRVGRKRLLVLGWLFALPVPLILIYAQDWNLVVIANILLGISQGLTWSSTVVMKIDLVGTKDRGLAMGLNEFAGYLAVGIVAYFTASIAASHGLRPYPFYIGIGMSLAGLLLSVFVVKDTRKFVEAEQSDTENVRSQNVFMYTTFTDPNLSATTQAGIVNNLNDGMIWGLLPLLLISMNFDKNSIGILVAIYPVVWGVSQLFTGKLADMISNKQILFWGMIVQGAAIIALSEASTFAQFAGLGVILGLGTALVYPTFFVVIAKYSVPIQRAESIGVFRFWRDLGYAIGALLSGLIADIFSVPIAILSIGIITIASGLIIQFRMIEVKD